MLVRQGVDFVFFTFYLFYLITFAQARIGQEASVLAADEALKSRKATFVRREVCSWLVQRLVPTSPVGPSSSLMLYAQRPLAELRWFHLQPNHLLLLLLIRHRRTAIINLLFIHCFYPSRRQHAALVVHEGHAQLFVLETIVAGDVGLVKGGIHLIIHGNVLF